MNVNALTSRELKLFNTLSYARNRSVNLGTRLQAIIANLAVLGTPINAVNATGLLTLTGVVTDGEKILIGDQIYEFAADSAQTVGAPGTIAMDIVEFTVEAEQTLTVDTQPTVGDTMTIGTKEYTFVAIGTEEEDGEISVGDDLGEAQVNIVAAINGTDEFNIAHALVYSTDFDDDVCSIIAFIGGTVGNTIDTTETFDEDTNVFGAGHLASGADCSAANAKTVIIAEITTHDTQDVTPSSGDGTTVVFTADIAGVAAEDIITGTQLANGSFGHAHLFGGVNGTVSRDPQDVRYDSTYLYITISPNTIAGKNWRRVALGSAYY